MAPVTLIALAKSPVPGRVKTRLSPPCSPAQAATLARAALADTLDALVRTPATRRVLALDGDPEGLDTSGFEVIPQRGLGLGERLQAAFDDVGGPALLVGMDTPQLHPEHLLAAVSALGRADVDAVLGPAPDGGYWSIGFTAPVAGAFAGVPMSHGGTCEAQRRRLVGLGLRLCEQPSLRDVDTIADAEAVARAAPGTRFARTLARIR